jgi:macrolide transport system ATP-binding/permease protein
MRARLRSLLSRLFGRRAFEADLDAELGFHLAARADDLARRGLSPDAARRQAAIELGGAERFKDECRQAVGLRLADEIVADLRYGARGLRRDRGFAIVAVTVLGLTIGANTALFTFLNTYFLKALPIAAADRHVELSRQTPGVSRAGWTLDEIEVMRTAGAGVIEQGYAIGTRRPTLIRDEPIPLYVEAVSASFFALAEPRYIRGRGFDASNDWKGSAAPSVILSHAGWRRLTAADPDIVGRALSLDGVSFTVVGVTVESFSGVDVVTPDLWLAAPAAEQVLARRPSPGAAGRQAGFYNFSALLRPGVSREQAADVLTRALAQLPAGDPALRDAKVGVRARTTLMRESEDLAPLALALLAAFGATVLIAGANLTNMQLARGAARARDIALRVSLGASRWRLIRQIVTESVLVAALGGVAGYVLAGLTIEWLHAYVFSLVSNAGMTVAPVALDWRAFVFTLGLALLVGCATGLVPALEATRPDLRQHLSGGVAGTGLRPRRLRDALLVAQVGASFLLLVAAGLLLQVAARAERVDVGRDLGRLVDLRFDAPTRALMDRLSASPGVVGVAAASHTPLTGPLPRTSVQVDGQQRRIAFQLVDDRFFGLMETPIRRGRGFDAGDASSRARTVIVSAATARALWPGRDPLGRTLTFSEPPDGDPASAGAYEVVGVADDVVSGLFFQGVDATHVYIPAAVGSPGMSDLIVRLRGDAVGAGAALRRVCREFAPGGCQPASLSEVLAGSRVPFTIAARISSSLGGLALALACLGLYGLVSFTVVQRTREIGVRLALGATRRAVATEVVSHAVRRVWIGLALGLPLGLALSWLVAAYVLNAGAFDPRLYLTIGGGLLLAATLAAAIPARRAARVDPLIALRHD